MAMKLVVLHNPPYFWVEQESSVKMTDCYGHCLAAQGLSLSMYPFVGPSNSSLTNVGITIA